VPRSSRRVNRGWATLVDSERIRSTLLDVNDEQTVIERARQGDPQALELLAVEYAPRVLRFGLKMCRDEHDAREIAQQTMLSLVEHLPSFRDESRFSTWLFTIARSHCIKHRTRGAALFEVESSEQHAELEVPAVTAAPDEQLWTRQLESTLDDAIRRLEPRQREVVMLRDVEGLPAADVAKVLELSVEAVKSRLHRARKELRDALAPWFDAHAPSASCPDVVELLSRYQEGEVTSESCKVMEAHVAGCPACASRCRALRTVLSACSAAPAPKLPEDLRRLVREQIRRSLHRQKS
jgi:RNA polymerase sigma-70 factor, ECF subfamily